MVADTPPPPRLGLWPRVKAAFLPFVLAVAVGAWLGLGVVPDLVTDLGVSSRVQPAPGARLVSGRCRSRMAVLHDCELELSARTRQGEVRRKVEYLFATFTLDSFSVQQILAPPDQPGVLIADIGHDRLVNRTVFALVMAGIGVGLLGWSVSALLRG